MQLWILSKKWTRKKHRDSLREWDVSFQFPAAAYAVYGSYTFNCRRLATCDYTPFP